MVESRSLDVASGRGRRFARALKELGWKEAPRPARVILRCSPFLPDSQLMSNVASALKEEISRISRKEIHRETSSLKKSSTAYRSEIAALKRRVQELERQLRRASRGRGADLPSCSERRLRLARHSLQRQEHGVTTATSWLVSSRMRPLIGASAQSIYNWEEGKARPRAQHMPAIFALRQPRPSASERDPGEPQSRVA